MVTVASPRVSAQQRPRVGRTSLRGLQIRLSSPQHNTAAGGTSATPCVTSATRREEGWGKEERRGGKTGGGAAPGREGPGAALLAVARVNEQQSSQLHWGADFSPPPAACPPVEKFRVLVFGNILTATLLPLGHLARFRKPAEPRCFYCLFLALPVNFPKDIRLNTSAFYHTANFWLTGHPAQLITSI